MRSRSHGLSCRTAYCAVYVFIIHLTWLAAAHTVAASTGSVHPLVDQQARLRPWHQPAHASIVKRARALSECQVYVDSSKPAEAGRCLYTFGVEGLAGICQTYDRAFIGFSALCVKHVQHPEKGPVSRPGS